MVLMGPDGLLSPVLLRPPPNRTECRLRRYARCRVHVRGTREGMGKDGSRDQEGGRLLGASGGGEGGWSIVD